VQHHVQTDAQPVQKQLLAPSPKISPLIYFCVMSHGREYLWPVAGSCPTSAPSQLLGHHSFTGQYEKLKGPWLCATLLSHNSIVTLLSMFFLLKVKQTIRTATTKEVSSIPVENRTISNTETSYKTSCRPSSAHKSWECSSSFRPHNNYSTTCYLLPQAPTNSPHLSSGHQSEEGGPLPLFYWNLTTVTSMAGNRSVLRRASLDNSHNHCPHLTGTHWKTSKNNLKTNTVPWSY